MGHFWPWESFSDIQVSLMTCSNEILRLIGDVWHNMHKLNVTVRMVQCITHLTKKFHPYVCH